MNFVLSLIVALAWAATTAESCRTEEGRRDLVNEYARRGGPTPDCRPGETDCGTSYVLRQVCDGEAVRASCFTEAGRDLVVKNWPHPRPACGAECVRNYVMYNMCE